MPRAIEWPTLLIFVVTYGLWALSTSVLWNISPVLATLATALTIAQF